MSALLPMLSRLLRASLWLLAGVLMLAVLYVSLGRQFMPLVAEYRSEIEEQLQQRRLAWFFSTIDCALCHAR